MLNFDFFCWWILTWKTSSFPKMYQTNQSLLLFKKLLNLVSIIFSCLHWQWPFGNCILIGECRLIGFEAMLADGAIFLEKVAKSILFDVSFKKIYVNRARGALYRAIYKSLNIYEFYPKNRHLWISIYIPLFKVTWKLHHPLIRICA